MARGKTGLRAAGSMRGKLLPSLDDAIDMFARALRAAPPQNACGRSRPADGGEGSPVSA
jgi:hypothetical protein